MEMDESSDKKLDAVQSLNNTLHYNKDLDITRSCCGSHMFYHVILQRNYRKLTMEWNIPCPAELGFIHFENTVDSDQLASGEAI